MQMNNIFEKQAIPKHYFNNLLKTNFEWNLLNYLNDNLKRENNIILTWELDTALTINANE
jgi:hypothetical protein